MYEKSKQVLRAHSTGGAPCREHGVRYGHRNVALVALLHAVCMRMLLCASRSDAACAPVRSIVL